MIVLGEMMHRESEFKAFDYDYGKLLDLAERIKNNDDMYGECARNNTGDLVGMFVGSISEYYFGRDLIAADLLWYVHPDHRGGTVAVRLLKHFTQWGQNMGVKEICIGVSTGVQTERTGDLLDRLNFACVGGTYKRRVC